MSHRIVYLLINILLGLQLVFAAEDILPGEERKTERAESVELEDQQRETNSTICSDQVSILYQPPSDDLLKKYITNYIINNQDFPESQRRKSLRITTKIIGAGVGAFAGIPFIVTACDAAKGIKSLCNVFIAGTVISYGSASSWAFLRLTEHLDPKSREEVSLKEKNKVRNFISHFGAHILGLLSTIPDGYAVYKYNANLLLTIYASLIDYAFKTEGYYILFNERHVLKDKQLRLIRTIRERLIPDILNNPHDLISKIQSEEFFEILEGQYIREATDETLRAPPELWRGGIPRRAIVYLSYLFPLGNAIVNGTLTFQALGLLLDTNYIKIPLSVLIVTPGFRLDIYATSMMAESIFDKIYNIMAQRNYVSFVNKYYPKIAWFFVVFSFFLSLSSAMGDGFVAYDTLSASSFSFMAKALSICVIVSNSIFETFAMMELFYDFFMTVGNLFYDSTRGEVVSTIKKLNQLISFIKNEDL